jgi:tetratricopeptide (TPR) repeat protein
MFTFNIYLKFAAIAICLFGGIGMAFAFGFWWAFPFILTGILLLVSYILLGTVQSAAQMMEKMDFTGSLKRLDLTFFPKWLYKPNRAYYFMIKGSIAAQLKDYDRAEEFLSQSKAIGLPTGNEKAMVALQLANFAALKNKWNQAQLYMKEIKDYKVTEPAIKEQIKQFEKAMQQRGQQKHMMGGDPSMMRMRRMKRF